jgi:peptidyl-prolyl cis-trans isomerase C
MAIIVNGAPIPEAEIEREIAHHAEAPDARDAATQALVVRELLLQEAHRLDVTGADDDTVIEALLAREVRVPEATEPECETFYRNNRRRFRSPDLVEASHILFQASTKATEAAMRTRAESVLQVGLAHPERFTELARTHSQCPSAAQGGTLGQLTRGQTVPEFEAALFSLGPGRIRPTLLATRFGLHILRVDRRIDGDPLPFEVVKQGIADYLIEHAQQRALQQYLRILVGQADIRGIKLDGAATPLVQ